ncbi:N-acetyltransferase [Psychroserpens sp. SPM9]|uniref:GNAT family N-acetyltransferase n=1 Tax=Psychroserpens sp. SPM9 TaxID=2975598 RepID=UPI0021A2C9BD|nr:N-acetyltransferase [Psychroserpens sp. SPM9]MDG5491992.1 N-acetyltransferase [Psychroserpens sp. SPM9]
MNSNFKIRNVVKDDLTRIFQLEEEAFGPNNYPLFVLRQLYDIFPDLFLVAVDELNQIKGYCFGGIDYDHKMGWVFALAVVKSEQKKKIGQHMTSKLLTVFKNKNISTIQLTTTPDNSAAISLYEKLGFKKKTEVMNYYFDNSPRLLMKLELN